VSLDASLGEDESLSLLDLVMVGDDGVARVGESRRVLPFRSRPSNVRRRVRVPFDPADPGDARHGTVNGYSNLGCRCERCRTASTERARADRLARRLRARRGEGPPHGSVSRYTNWGCRCLLCSQARYEDDLAKGRTAGGTLATLRRFERAVAETSPQVGLPRLVRMHHSYRESVSGLCVAFVDLGPRWGETVRCSFRASRSVGGSGYCERHAKRAEAAMVAA
jgi:hypothetical protein